MLVLLATCVDDGSGACSHSQNYDDNYQPLPTERFTVPFDIPSSVYRLDSSSSVSNTTTSANFNLSALVCRGTSSVETRLVKASTGGQMVLTKSASSGGTSYTPQGNIDRSRLPMLLTMVSLNNYPSEALVIIEKYLLPDSKLFRQYSKWTTKLHHIRFQE